LIWGATARILADLFDRIARCSLERGSRTWSTAARLPEATTAHPARLDQRAGIIETEQSRCNVAAPAARTRPDASGGFVDNAANRGVKQLHEQCL